MIICIDPGHVEYYNRGAYDKYYEGSKMFNLAVMLKEELEKYKDINVVLTRNNVKENPSLYQRGMIAKNNKARCFISLHSDACGAESVNRISVFRSINAPKSVSLGNSIMNTVVSVIKPFVSSIQSNPDGVLTRTYIDEYGNTVDYYGVIRNSIGGSVEDSFIIEHGFHTNYKQSEWLYSDDNLRKLAIAEAKSIATYYGCFSMKPISNNINIPNQMPSNNNTTYTNYIVQYGDSWWSIASKKLGSGIKMNELASYNNKNINSMLKVGEVIKIPSNIKTNTYKKYIVVKGDSWWSIAKKEMCDGTKYKYLAQYNGKSSDEPLIVGQVVNIPSNT